MSRPHRPLDPAVAARVRLAAAREFSALGFKHASLNRIVTNAQISKSSLYHHIGSKQALLNDLLSSLTTVVDEALQLLDPERLTATTFWPVAEAGLADIVRAGEEHPELGVVASLVYQPDGDVALRQLRTLGVGRVRAYLERGQQLGMIRRDQPAALLAEIAIATLLAIDAWALTATGDATPGAALSALTALRTALEGP